MAYKKSIVISGTNIRLYEGDFVTIKNRSDIKWIVHYGWYIYQNVKQQDWYFSATTTGEILPVSYVDLTLVSLTTSATRGSIYHDGTNTEYSPIFTEDDAEVLNRSFISVDTITQRDNLDRNKLTNGRLVRVNDYGGSAKYYAWNEQNKHWDEVSWGSGGDKEIFYGTTEYWNAQPQLISIKGGMYVYSDHSTDDTGKDIAGVKIGDGTSYLIDMPFLDEQYAQHLLDTKLHVSQEDRDKWDNKVRCYIDPQNTQHIIFTTD